MFNVENISLTRIEIIETIEDVERFFFRSYEAPQVDHLRIRRFNDCPISLENLNLGLINIRQIISHQNPLSLPLVNCGWLNWNDLFW